MVVYSSRLSVRSSREKLWNRLSAGLRSRESRERWEGGGEKKRDFCQFNVSRAQDSEREAGAGLVASSRYLASVCELIE
jgi:hypothetical protein